MKLSRFKTLLTICMICMLSTTVFSAINSCKVKIFKNDVPIQMINLNKIESNGISILYLPQTIDSGKTTEAGITCSVGNEFPKKGGSCYLQFKVSKLFISKEVTIELKTSKIENHAYILKGRYKIGKDSSKWSNETTIAKFSNTSGTSHHLTTNDMKNILVIKKL